MEELTVTSPYDGHLLDTLPLMDKEAVEQAILRARTLFDTPSRHLNKVERIEIMKKCVTIMTDSVEELTKLAASEGGKPYVDSKVEVIRAINGVELAIEQMGFMGGKEIPMGHTASSLNRMAYTMKEPIGVVASISAFNHPLNLSVHQIIPAFAVGAPVLIKPALLTPLSALRFAGILKEAGMPEDWVQVIICADSEAEFLATHDAIDYLSFIGSAKVGWYLNSKVSPGTRVGLEHGGVAPVIIEHDADIEAVIPALVKGGFYHAGQVCVSVQRIYVHESIANEVCTKMSKAANQLRIGDPLDPSTEVGPLIRHSEGERIASWIEEAQNGGATLLCGGKKISDSLFEATILLNPPKKATISTQEVFGPVVCIYTYSDLDDAINAANALDVSFQAAIFTKNIDTALYGVKRLNGTAVMVNDHTAFRVDWMPFGGAKASGLGLGGIPYSMEEMSHDKLMVIKSNVL